ncbi:hypothetical protein BN1723_013590 [Verticillium longisporum]|uniref:Glycosyl hydrolase family 78 alpha-rhamnosidase N-terminal domain-containing protein n=1 Tax=Verticillium longisporum TaxID=100787 RepID=A0A0G4LTV4_VERLO|nr:hypothetical protein BN1723_013590 [Verticillium longisporum]
MADQPVPEDQKVDKDVKPKVVITFGPDEAAYSRGFVLDFGSHNVGYVSFHLGAEGLNMNTPARLRLTLGEVINVDWVPTDVAIPRRHAFRPLRVQTFDTSPKCKMKFGGIVTRSESAVPPDHPVEPCPVPETNDDGAKLLRRINAATRDHDTGRELWQTVLSSTKAALAYIGEEGIFSRGAWSGWKFLDWAKELDRDAGMYGLVILGIAGLDGT